MGEIGWVGFASAARPDIPADPSAGFSLCLIGDPMSHRKLLFAAILALFALQSMASTNDRPNLPKPANWDVTFQPYTGKAEQAMPVQVTMFDVKTSQGGMWVREWRLKNRSTKPVTKLRLAWFVWKDQEPEPLLVRREVRRWVTLTLSPGTDWPSSTCPPEWKSCQSAFATYSLDELMEPLLTREDPNAKYRVSLAVDKVQFDDGSTWEFESAQKE
jgi:hypothetical protein